LKNTKRKKNIILKLFPYQNIINKISQCYIEGKIYVVLSLNEYIINTNWNIGKYNIEYEQDWMQKGKYSDKGAAYAA